MNNQHRTRQWVGKALLAIGVALTLGLSASAGPYILDQIAADRPCSKPESRA